MTVSIVLADGHPVVREGLRAILEAEPNLRIVAETGDGIEAIRLVERQQPDLLVLATLLPGLSGLDVLSIVRNRSPRTRIIIFADFDSETVILQALRYGASAYVLKGADLDEVLEAVRRVASGQRYLSPALSERAFDAYWEKAATDPDDPHDQLTPRERQALQLAAEGGNCTEIAGRLSISPRTAEMHRSNALRKLGLRTQADLIRYALRRGMLPPEG